MQVMVPAVLRAVSGRASGPAKTAYRSLLPYVGCLSFRAINVAGQAIVTVSSADTLSSGFRPLGWLNRPETLNDGFVDAQRNFFSAPRKDKITAEQPEWIVLSWPEAQTLDLIGVCAVATRRDWARSWLSRIRVWQTRGLPPQIGATSRAFGVRWKPFAVRSGLLLPHR